MNIVSYYVCTPTIAYYSHSITQKKIFVYSNIPKYQNMIIFIYLYIDGESAKPPIQQIDDESAKPPIV